MEGHRCLENRDFFSKASIKIGVATQKASRILDELEGLKRHFGDGPRELLRKLRQLGRLKIDDPELLLRFHETLLFFRAYPPSPEVLKQAETTLKTFAGRLSQLRADGIDLSVLDDPEVSGIAGTTVTSNFSYPIVCWFIQGFPAQLSIDWDWFEDEERFGATMPRFLPLLEEDAMVEAHVPYHDWLRAAVGRSSHNAHELSWIIKRFEALPLPGKAKAELYDALKLHVTWRFKFSASRTGMRLPTRKVFFHDQPLIQRRDVSLIGELESPPIPVEKLSLAAGRKIVEMTRETSAVRYRELHGFTYGDAGRVLKADLGRGVEAFVMGVGAENRLPLRAYHAAMIFKNGVPVAYFESLSLFEHMESGFNLYYTFRDGETAWLFARILRLMKQLLNVTVFSVDPYQIGHENEEGIESGAFWFYRKLGFRPVRPELMKLALAEEQKIETRRAYRTPARTLRRLAAGHMLFELTPKQSGKRIRVSVDWDRFEVRKLGFAVQRLMAREFDGDAARARRESARTARQTLGIDVRNWTAGELCALDDLALVLALIADVRNWSTGEKQLAARIIRAKAANEESRYLRLMQQHTRLRAATIRLGSS